MTAAAVRAALESAGLEIVVECSFAVIARGAWATVHALQYPCGWRLANAKNHPTRVLIAKQPADVVRYCAEMNRGGDA